MPNMSQRELSGLAGGLRCSITLVLTSLCLTFAMVPGAVEKLQLDRTAVAGGEWWRIVTGHFVHWNGDHLFWDLAVFLVLGAFCERRGRAPFLFVLAMATLIIPAVVGYWLPELETYRGLSGLDSALFVLFASSCLIQQWQERRWVGASIIVGLMIGLVAKIGFEVITEATLFVNAAVAGFEPVPLAHMTGAAIGLLPLVWQTTGRAIRGSWAAAAKSSARMIGTATRRTFSANVLRPDP